MIHDHQLVRVRFAPSPTGFMHLGNVRTALLNFLFAKRYNGTFVVRIEDTDASRNFDPGAQQIQQDLSWLGLKFQEGPGVDGQYGPYFQSERQSIYQDYLTLLIHKKAIYRCFCTNQDLEKKRARQIALKQPPRYDKTCAYLNESEIDNKLAHHLPYIWRMRLDPELTLTITDLARGTVTFEMRNFSDFPLSRADGTFTFMFANFVDDAAMRISHVLRGEDHLSNTAGQAALYHAVGLPMPLFWHLPILCNEQGSKLSKRDFGFALRDLRASGYVPEAIVNYLAIIGGGSFEHEIMDTLELADAFNFEHIQSTGQVRYDLEKLLWVNQKWIARYELEKLTQACLPFLSAQFPEIAAISHDRITLMINLVRAEMKTLADAARALRFIFELPDLKQLAALIPAAYSNQISNFFSYLIEQPITAEQINDLIRSYATKNQINTKTLFHAIRLALTGSVHGPSLIDVITLLGSQQIQHRLQKATQALSHHDTF